jgi:hypothetical protein
VDTAPVLPGLDPAVPVFLPVGVDRPEVAAEWPGWWSALLEWARLDLRDDPDRDYLSEMPIVDTSPALAHRPAIRSALTALSEPATSYSRTHQYRKTSGLSTMETFGEVVRDVEAELGRRAAPFRLVITPVWVRGMVWERLTTHHVLASTRFIESATARPALRDVVVELA